MSAVQFPQLLEPPKRATKQSARGRMCKHCGGPTSNATDNFCCEGCHHVYDLLRDEGLARYYDLRSGAGVPVLERGHAAGNRAWLDVAVEQLSREIGLTTLQLDVEGLHCTGCVWLIEELFRRTASEGTVIVNPALGVLDLTVPPTFDLRTFYLRLTEVGYQLGPHRKQLERASDDLVWRLGVCVAISMNAMIFAIARYAGLEAGSLETVFLWLELALAVAAFAVGGIVFVRAAVRSLARAIVHLDLPIAMGLMLGYVGSFIAVLQRRPSGSFFDTLIVFTTVMLVGRFLRERVLEKNRAQLLDDAGIDAILCRRIHQQRVEVVPVTAIACSDQLLIAPGDVVPVNALALQEGTISLDWVTGESEPRAVTVGTAVRAGAANAGCSAFLVEAREPFSTSRLVRLLQLSKPSGSIEEHRSRFEAKISSLWVPGVLVAATVGFLGHYLSGDGVASSLSVAVAVLVVTCPCAFGIATPIAYEIVLGALRKRGLLVRSKSFLERALDVRRVVFDKTGTLTGGDPSLSDTTALARLTPATRTILYNLACRSSHPKSGAIKAALASDDPKFEPSIRVVELAGKGTETVIDGHVYRLGAGAATDVAFTRDGAPLAELATVEALRADAAGEIEGLRSDGYEIWMATGDTRPRAMAVADRCGIPHDRVLADQSPEEKASFVSRVDRHDTLMIGDGINDGPAVQTAYCSGTPAAGRAFLAARTDFYLLTPGLGPVRKGLAAAHALRRTLKRNLVWAVMYNVIALSLAYAGLMTPLLCAILMPASSLVSIALVLRALGPKGSIWRS